MPPAPAAALPWQRAALPALESCPPSLSITPWPPPSPLLQLVPAVTELIIAEMLYLQHKDRTKPMYLYINSTGGRFC